MDTNKRPRAHEKKESGQSVHVNKTDKVETGHGPVGSGARPQAGQSRPQSAGGSSKAVRRATGGSSVLILLVVLFLLFRGCGGSMGGAQSQTQQAQPQQQTVQPTAAPAATQAPTAAPAPVNAAARARYYTPKANDSVTIMVYMCGTDLESNYGMATSDLQEMASAAIGQNVNVIVETGGCKMWKNRIVSNASNQIYKVESGGVRLVKDNLGRKAMVESSTLVEFLKFCRENYPADRNILIFWDHGGGSISGYGYDELYKSAGSMDLAEIASALKTVGGTYDWIGFDACLMATLETALVCEGYADYMIASEETEPGTGWYYTNWLNQLSKNTAVDTPALAKTLIDDFVKTSTGASASAKVGLSLTDLAALSGAVPGPFRDFATSTTELLSNKNYAVVSNARASARQFAQSSRINQIDLVDFANYVGTPEAKALSQALLGCVKYNNTNISHAYGLSIYFPYETMNTVKTAVSTYKSVGMDDAYTKCISSFASLASSGQLAASSGYSSGMDIGSLLSGMLGSSSPYSGNSYGSGNLTGYGSPLGALLGGYSSASQPSSSGMSVDPAMIAQLLGAFSGRNLPAEMDWVDEDTVSRSVDYISENYIDPADLFTTVRADGAHVLTLSAAQWDLIQDVVLNVYVDDGEGFIDLGLDNIDFEFDGDDLVMKFAGEWMTINGHPAAYYMLSVTDDAEGYLVRGRIPALLNGELVDLEVVFDDENPYGVITGARPMYEDVDVVAKGDIAIEAGDELQFLCDYYGRDGSYESTYKLGEPFTVGSAGLSVEYSKLDEDLSVTYRLTDIYSNHYWLPAWAA